jgi:hypothetical protein
MNRNLNGTPLTRADLIALALEAGMPASKITVDAKTWVFAEASRDLRFAMWARGELVLDTRPEPRVAPSNAVDWEIVAAISPVSA